MLYDYIQCPHKVWRDIYGPKDEKIIETNPFVELLWQKGVIHEKKVVAKLGKYIDLSKGSLDERINKTLLAMQEKSDLIYQGVLRHDNLLGIPDLLKRLPDDSYIPIDIKSGMAYEGENEETGEEGKPKKHYSVQLCLYNELLRQLNFAKHTKGIILDIRGDEVEYDLNSVIGKRSPLTWVEFYESIKTQLLSLINNQTQNKPAQGGKCKLCAWYDSCKKWCEKNNDLSNVFYLGRSVRDVINRDLSVENTADFLNIDLKTVMKQKEYEKKQGNSKFLYRIGKDSLKKLLDRAKILYQTKKPVIYNPIVFPKVKYELFFDIEDDPTQDFVYLHGIYVRKDGSEQFLDFTSLEISDEAEKKAWQGFWQYIDSLPQDDFAVYFYSHHEKTTYKKLQKRYPDVISPEKLEAFFDNPNVIDLYKIVQKQTDWPLGSYSLKALATYLGFKWRDETPSGALSIQWFNQYIETKDEKIIKRILEYNEDDCKATMILKDALEALNNKMF